MRVLLDTHALLWALAEPHRLSPSSAAETSSPLVPWLFAETGGQPLYLMETIRALSEPSVGRRLRFVFVSASME